MALGLATMAMVIVLIVECQRCGGCLVVVQKACNE